MKNYSILQHKISFVFVFFLVFIFSCFPIHNSAYAINGKSVGRIHVPNGEKPENFYKLFRNEKEIKELSHSMEVRAGDIVAPINNKTVWINLDNRCNSEIGNTKQPVVVSCKFTEMKESENIFALPFIHFYETFLKLKAKETIDATILALIYGSAAFSAVTTKGGGSCECLPDEEFRFSRIPQDNSTHLHGEEMLFSYKDKDNECCEEAELVLMDSKGIEVHRESLLLGEIMSTTDISGKLKGGEVYRWHINLKGKKISGEYRLKVLDKKRTTYIKSMLKSIEDHAGENDPILMQAFFLQILSNGREDINLYEKSLRMLLESDLDLDDNHYVYVLENLANSIHAYNETSDDNTHIDPKTAEVKIEKNEVDADFIKRLIGQTRRSLSDSFIYEEHKGNFKEALQYVELTEKALEVYDEDEDLLWESCYLKAKVLDLMNRHSEAIKIYDVLLKDSNDDKEKVALIHASRWLSTVSQYVSPEGILYMMTTAQYMPDISKKMGDNQKLLKNMMKEINDTSIKSRLRRLMFIIHKMTINGAMYSAKDNLGKDKIKGSKAISSIENVFNNYLKEFREWGGKEAEAYVEYSLTDFFFLVGEEEAAIISSKRAIEIYRELDDEIGEANVHMRKGDYFIGPNNSPDVFNLSTVNKGLSITMTKDFGSQYVELSQKEVIDNLDKTKNYYSVALKLYEREGSVRGRAEIMLRKGYIAFIENKAADAYTYYERAAKLFESVGDFRGKNRTLLHLANLNISKQQFNEAKTNIDEIINLFKYNKNYGILEGVGATLESLGINYYYANVDHERALFCFETAITCYENLEAPITQAFRLNEIITLYRKIGQYNKSLNLVDKALGYIKKYAEKPTLPKSFPYLNLKMNLMLEKAINSYEIGHYKKSVEFLNEMRTLGKTSDNPEVWEGAFNFYMTYVNILQENFSEALKYAKQGEENVLLSGIYTKKKEFDKSIDVLLKELADTDKKIEEEKQKKSFEGVIIIHKNHKATVLYNLIHVYRKSGQCDKSFKMLNEWNDLDVTWSDRLHKPWDFDDMVGRIFECKKEYQKAYEHYDKAVNSLETNREQFNVKEFRESFVEGKQDVYEHTIKVLLKMHESALEKEGSDNNNYDEMAFGYMERAKSRTLLEILQSVKRDLAGYISDEERKAESLLNSKIKKLNLAIALEGSKKLKNNKKLTQLRSDLRKARETYNRFMTNLYIKYPGLALKHGQSKVLKGREAVKLAGDNNIKIVEYYVGKETLFVFVVTEDGLKSYSMNMEKSALKKKIAALRSPLQEIKKKGKYTPGKYKYNRELAGKIYNLIVKPFESELNEGDTISIVPDKFLFALPFQALIDNNGKYLVQNYKIFYAPSTTVLYQLMKTGTETKKAAALMVFGDPVLGKRGVSWMEGRSYKELLQAGKEIDKLKEIFTANIDVYQRERMLEDTFKKEAPNARSLHLSTHGLLDSKSPMFSGLLFSQGISKKEDGFLEAREIMDLNLSNVNLAVTSACETRLGRVTDGEGIIGLTRAFFTAGVNSVLVSLWSVADAEPTTLLMERFYREIRAGKSKTEALQRAQVKLIEESEYTSPFYWAPFVLAGGM